MVAECGRREAESRLKRLQAQQARYEMSSAPTHVPRVCVNVNTAFGKHGRIHTAVIRVSKVYPSRSSAPGIMIEVVGQKTNLVGPLLSRGGYVGHNFHGCRRLH